MRFASLYPVLILLCAIYPSPAFSHPADGADAAPEEKPERPWQLTINGGLTINSGNTRSRVFNGEADFSLHLDGFELDTQFDTLYGRSESEVVQNKGKWANSFSRRLNGRLNYFGQVVLEYDAMAGISLRTTAGLGIRVNIHDRESLKSRLTLSLNGEFLNLRGEYASQQSLRMQVLLSSEARLSPTAVFKARLMYTPDLADLRRDYRIEADASLSLLMKKPLWIILKFKDRFDNFPSSPEVEKNDLTLITAVELRF